MSYGIIERVRQTAPYWWAPNRMLYYVGCLGLNNLGDELMLPAIRRLFPDWPFACHWPVGPFALQRLVQSRDFRAALLGGGTLIAGGPTWHNHLRFAKALSRFRYGVVFGTGVSGAGPNGMTPMKWKNLQDWRRLLERCNYIGVRGPFAARQLARIDIDAEVIGDPVCQFALDDVELRQPRPVLGINIGMAHDQDHQRNEQLLNSFIRLIRCAADHGMTTEFFVVRPGDEQLTRTLCKQSGAFCSQIHSIYADPDAFIDKVRNLSMFVGVKLHAVALAACSGVPAVSIAYEVKCLDFMHSIGLGDHVVALESMTAELLQKKMDKVLIHGQRASLAAVARMQQFKEIQKRRSREIAAAILGESAWPVHGLNPERN